MQLYCSNGVVIAWHDDGQTVPASVYGAGVTVLPFSGDWPPAGPRPYAVPTIALADLQQSLCADIDRQAQAQRDLYVTPGGAQSATYLIKQSQAQSALAAQSANTSANMTAAQLAAAYPYLANEIGITPDPTSQAPATDVYGVARAVMAVLTAWQPLNLAIEAMRLKTKAAIGAATTAAAAQAAHDAVAWSTAST